MLQGIPGRGNVPAQQDSWEADGCAQKGADGAVPQGFTPLRQGDPRDLAAAGEVPSGVTTCKQDMALPSWRKLGEIAAKKPQPRAKWQQVMLCFSSDFHRAVEEFFPLFKMIFLNETKEIRRE